MDNVDNCPDDFNPFQEDFDNDGFGDACDSQHSPTQLHEVKNNMYLSTSYTGIILTDSKDACWVLVVQEDGSLKTISADCP